MKAREHMLKQLTRGVEACDKSVDNFVRLAGQDVAHAVQWHAKDAMRCRACRHSLDHRLKAITSVKSDTEAIAITRHWLQGFYDNALSVTGRTVHHTSNPYEALRYEAENAGEAQAARYVEDLLVQLKPHYESLSSFEPRLGA